MTKEEKGIVRVALLHYEIAIKDSLTKEEHTEEEVQAAFDAWNITTKLIKRFSE